MSAATKIAALPGLLAHWACAETAGASTAADDAASANTFPLTAGTGATFGTADGQGGTCVRLDGTGATPLTRAVASGSTLDLHDNLTMGMLIRINSRPSSGTPDLAGRGGSFFTIRMITAGNPRVQINSTGVQAGSLASAQTNYIPPVNEWMHMAMTLGNGWVSLWLNGVMVKRYKQPSAIPAGTGNFTLGALNVSFDIKDAFLCSKELGEAHLRDLANEYVTASLVPATTYSDLQNAAAPSATILGLGGGRIATGDPIVIDASGNLWRADIYGSQSRHRPAAYPTAGTAADVIPRQAVMLGEELINTWSKRAHALDLAYHDGTKFLYGFVSDPINGSGKTFQRSSSGLIALAATIHRMSGAPKSRSYMLDLVKTIGDYLLTHQGVSGATREGLFFDELNMTPNPTVNGGGGAAGNETDFVANQFGYAVLLTRRDLDATRRANYISAIDKAAVNIAGSTYGFGSFWTNGNRNLQAALCLYLAWLLTGSTVHKTAFDAQWSALTSPTGPPVGFTSAYGPSASASGMGLQVPVILDVSAATTSFTLTYKGQTTSAITLATSAKAIYTAMKALSTVPQIANAKTGAPGGSEIYDLHVTAAGTGKFALRLPGAPGSYVNGDLTVTPAGGTAAVTRPAAAASDGSDGKAFLVETGGYNVTNFGSATESPWGAPGVDWDYLDLQTRFAIRLHRLALYAGDGTTAAGALKLLNQLQNFALDRVTTSTMVIDQTGGSRHTLSQGYITPGVAYLQWKGYRSDLSAFDVSVQWEKQHENAYFRDNTDAINEGYYASAGDCLAEWIAAGNGWPGIPA